MQENDPDRALLPRSSSRHSHRRRSPMQALRDVQDTLHEFVARGAAPGSAEDKASAQVADQLAVSLK